MSKRRILAVSLAVAASVAAPGFALAQSDDRWGSIVFSQEPDGDYAWGIAWSFADRQSAANAAMGECRGEGGSACSEVGWFRSACGAIAIGDGGGMGTGAGGAEAAAEWSALAECSKVDANCRIAASECAKADGAGEGVAAEDAPGLAPAQDRPDVEIRLVPGDASPPPEPVLSPADIVQIVDRGDAPGVDTTATTPAEKLAMVEEWLARGGDPNAAVNTNGATAMHRAAVFDAGNIAILERLIAHGGECDKEDSFGQTPLHFAAAQTNVGWAPGPASVRLLVGCGADPNRRDELDRTPLHAVFASVREFVGQAGVGPKNLEYGDDWRERDGFLRFFKGGANPEVARALIEAGADPNVRNVNGQTPLAMAVHAKAVQISMKRFDLMELLLGAGADPDLADNAGVAPLSHAILSLSSHTTSGGEAVRVIRTLLEAGADPDLRDGKGDTALVHAARYRPSAGREEYGLDADIAALLAGGADPCLAGADGKLPWELAVDDSRGKRLLREAGGHRDFDTGRCADGGAALAAAAEAEKALGLDRGARRRIQAALAARGFDPGAQDGIFGPRTRAAIRAWQADAGAARSTGYLSRADVDALLGAAAVAAAPDGDGPSCAGTADEPCWQAVENRPGCFVWNPYPQPEETVIWSGECLDGRPHGTGAVVWGWRKDGARRSSRGEGEFRRGISPDFS